MRVNWVQRLIRLIALLMAAVLAGCGASTIESQLHPGRIIAFGDGWSDVGQTGNRYTINDGTRNIWVDQLAANYGLTLTAVVSGGLGYAQGNARVASSVDASGGTATSITGQITQFLAGNVFADNDLVVIQGGNSDLIAEMMVYEASAKTAADSSTLLSNATTIGSAMGVQARRLVDAGAKYVILVGVYDMSRSPWGGGVSAPSLLSQASLNFNDALKIAVNGLGRNMLYVDAANYYNLITGLPGNYGFTDAASLACTVTDPTNAIGIGTGKVNAYLCDTTNATGAADVTKLVFADPVYFTPTANRTFGDYAYSVIRQRF